MDADDRLAPWVSTSTRLVLDHPFMHLVEDTLVLPTGTEARWLRYADHREGVEVPDAVTGICIDETGRVLVARQWGPGPERVVHEFPGGGTDVGEDYEAAVRRELVEEVGIHPHRVEAIGAFLLHPRKSGRRLRVYVATELEERPAAPEDTELIECEWLEPAAVDAAIADGTYDNTTLLSTWAIYRASRRDGQSPGTTASSSRRAASSATTDQSILT